MENSEKIGISFFIAILVICISVKIWQETDLKPRAGIVVSHDVSSNRNGDITYNSLVKCDDGYIRRVNDMSTYIVPIGGKVIIKTFN